MIEKIIEKPKRALDIVSTLIDIIVTPLPPRANRGVLYEYLKTNRSEYVEKYGGGWNYERTR